MKIPDASSHSIARTKTASSDGTIGAVSVEPGIGAVLIVAHVYRYPTDVDLSAGTPGEDRNGEEVIRIISARAAEADEIRRYQEQEVE